MYKRLEEVGEVGFPDLQWRFDLLLQKVSYGLYGGCVFARPFAVLQTQTRLQFYCKLHADGRVIALSVWFCTLSPCRRLFQTK